MSTQEDIIVKARGVTKVYTMGAEKVHALRGIDLDVRRGEYLSILGPSGSGKSTFFNMVGGLDKPTEGHVDMMIGSSLLLHDVRFSPKERSIRLHINTFFIITILFI